MIEIDEMAEAIEQELALENIEYFNSIIDHGDIDTGEW